MSCTDERLLRLEGGMWGQHQYHQQLITGKPQLGGPTSTRRWADNRLRRVTIRVTIVSVSEDTTHTDQPFSY